MKNKVIYHDDVLLGKTSLPETIIWDKGANRYRINPDLENRLSDTEKEELQNDFRRSLQMKEIYGKSEQLSSGLYIHDYLVYVPESFGLVFPFWIEGSIIRIDGFWPLVEHVNGVGVRKDHPCAMQEEGWNAHQLWSELMIGSWRVFDENELTTYCAEHKLNLIDNYDSCKAKKLL